MARIPTRLGVLIVIAVVTAAAVTLRLVMVGGGPSKRRSGRHAGRVTRVADKPDLNSLAREASAEDVEVACRAVQAMAAAGPTAAPQIKQAMADPRSKVRESAAVAMGRVLERDAEPARADAGALAELVEADRSANVRATAATALGAAYAFEEIETLIAAMGDDNVTVRRRAAAAAERILSISVDFKAEDPPEKRRAAVQRMREAWADPLIRERVIEYHQIMRERKRRR